MIINQATLTGIYKTFNTIFNEAFDLYKSTWPLIAMEAPSTGAVEDYIWLGDFPKMREWLGDRAIKDLSAFHYEIRNKDFESTVEVDRNNILDDKVGLYTPMFQGLGRAAAESPDELLYTLLAAVFTTLCYDGQYMIDTDHPVGDSQVSNHGGGASNPWFLMDLSRPLKPFIMQIRQRPQFVSQDQPEAENVFMRKKYRYGVDDRKNVGVGLWQLIYGSKQTFNATYYAAARTAMMAFVNERGTPLNIVPTHTIVGRSNVSAGRTLLKAEHDASGASNIWFNDTQLVEVPWLA